jgi:serine/threonine-protein kinase RsbW
MEMTILERDDEIMHVVLTGRLDTPGVEEIEEVMSSAISAQERPTIVELSSIAFLSSRGIGLLFANCRRLKKAGHQLVLLNPQGMVDETLRTVQAHKMMPIVYNLEDALKALQGIATAPSSSPSGSEVSLGESQPLPSQSLPDTATASKGTWNTSIKNELSELAGLNAGIAEFLIAHGVPRRASYAVNLAIDELVVNVIRYAYVDEETHLIDIGLEIEGDQIILHIVDDGRPFDPRKGPALDEHAEEREVGGLGLILVLDMVDALKYRREDDKNCVEVRVHLIPDAEESDPSTGVTSSAQARDQ